MTADLILLGLIALSALVGLWRGFIQEVFALVVWAFAFFAAYQFSGSVAVLFERHIDPPSLRTALGFAGIFLAVLVAGGLVNFLVGKLVQKTGLSGTDRMLGLIFGALRGVLLVLVLIIAAGFTPVPEDPWWAESRVIQSLLPLSDWLVSLLPESIQDLMRFEGDAELLPLPELSGET